MCLLRLGHERQPSLRLGHGTPGACSLDPPCHSPVPRGRHVGRKPRLHAEACVLPAVQGQSLLCLEVTPSQPRPRTRKETSSCLSSSKLRLWIACSRDELPCCVLSKSRPTTESVSPGKWLLPSARSFRGVGYTAGDMGSGCEGGGCSESYSQLSLQPTRSQGPRAVWGTPAIWACASSVLGGEHGPLVESRACFSRRLWAESRLSLCREGTPACNRFRNRQVSGAHTLGNAEIEPQTQQRHKGLDTKNPPCSEHRL